MDGTTGRHASEGRGRVRFGVRLGAAFSGKRVQSLKTLYRDLFAKETFSGREVCLVFRVVDARIAEDS